MDESVIYMGREENMNMPINERRTRNVLLNQFVNYVEPTNYNAFLTKPTNYPRRTRRGNKEQLTPIATVNLTEESEEESLEAENVPNSTKVKDNNKSDSGALLCPICFELLLNPNVRATQCGHLFCTKCLNSVSATFKGNYFKCPKCRKTIDKKAILTIYLE